MPVPDAPWIRETEIFGMPEPDSFFCPVCLEEAEYFFLDVNQDVVGCDCCVTTAAPFAVYPGNGEPDD